MRRVPEKTTQRAPMTAKSSSGDHTPAYSRICDSTMLMAAAAAPPITHRSPAVRAPSRAATTRAGTPRTAHRTSGPRRATGQSPTTASPARTNDGTTTTSSGGHGRAVGVKVSDTGGRSGGDGRIGPHLGPPTLAPVDPTGGEA